MSNTGKGLLGGTCNRAQCEGKGAVHFNASTRKYYCRTCAAKINMTAPNLCSINVRTFVEWQKADAVRVQLSKTQQELL